jgi:hypothetical protein
MTEIDHADLANRNEALRKAVHQAAVTAGVAFGMNLWDRFPPGLTMQIIRAGIEVTEIDFDPEHQHLIVMDGNGDLYKCESYASPPVLLS